MHAIHTIADAELTHVMPLITPLTDMQHSGVTADSLGSTNACHATNSQMITKPLTDIQYNVVVTADSLGSTNGSLRTRSTNACHTNI
jgi:hypothetical protein